jgi:hypothetical protein
LNVEWYTAFAVNQTARKVVDGARNRATSSSTGRWDACCSGAESSRKSCSV